MGRYRQIRTNTIYKKIKYTIGMDNIKIEEIEKLLTEYRDEEMPGWNEPFHYEAEGWQSMVYFLEWLKRKTNG
jgi:hypothetical protein